MMNKNSKRLRSRFTAILTAAALLLTPMLGSSFLTENVYANGNEPTTVTEALEAYNAAKAVTQAAQNDVNVAQDDYDAAEVAYNEAVDDRVSKEDLKNTAQSEYEAAQSATAQALQDMEAAETAKSNAEAALSQATTNLQAKEQAVTSAQNELNQAEQAVAAAEEQWENERAAAQTTLEEAQADFNRVGIDFLNQKAGDSLKDTDWFNWLKSNMRGKTYGGVSWNNVLDTDAFREGFYSPYSYENLMTSADLIKEGNVLRKSNTSTLPDLKISYKIMTESIASNALSNHVVGHVLMSDTDYKNSQLYMNCGRAGWENISWGASDPYMGWYYEEKIHYLADSQYGANQANVTESMVTQILNEATNNGHDLKAYFIRYGYGSTAASIRTKINSDRPSGNYSTGHYTNLINSGHKATGLSSNSKGAIYSGICHVQNFGQTEMNDAVTPDVFKSELESHAQTRITALNNAQNEVERLNTKPNYLQEAEANLTEKQSALATAEQEKADAETAKATAQSNLGTATTTLTNKTTAYNNAVTNKENKRTAYNNAVTEYDAAVQTVKEKETDKDEANGILETKNAALNEAQEAERAAKAVYDSFFDLGNAVVSEIPNQTFTGDSIEPDISDVKNKGETDTLLKGEDYTVNYSNNVNAGTATATINGTGSYNGSTSRTFRILAKDIGSDDVKADSIPEQVLENEAVRPAPVIRYNGMTLTNNDFDLEYTDNNTEGEGKIIVTGKNNYTGEIIINFDIIWKDRIALNNIIQDLENDLKNETDEVFIKSISEALEKAKAVATNPSSNKDQFEEAVREANRVRAAAQTELQKKKDAAKAAEEAKKKAEEEAKKKAEQEAAKKNAEQAAARAVQKGSDGTALGAGASAENAEKSILASTSDEGPRGSKFASLVLKSTAQTKNIITLTWKKNSKAKKYVIYGNACGKKNKMKKLVTLAGAKKTYKVKKLANKKALKKGTYHKFMIVALDKNNNVVSTSKVIHVATKGGKVGNHKAVTIKAKVDKNGRTIKSFRALSATKIKKGKSFVIKTTAIPVNKKLTVKKHRVVCYESSNPKIATVNAKGKITAKKKGTCYIYAYAQNGVFKKLKIIVK